MPEFDRYFASGGDARWRYAYDLKSTDIVVDAGAYQGMWSKKIYEQYKCKILAFEPVYFEIARANLKGTTAILNAVGLGDKNETLKISVLGDCTSVFKGSNSQMDIQIRDFVEVMNEYKVDVVALLKINIEGGEYGLLEHIINTGYVSKIRAIQVQFHDFMPDAVARRSAIQEKLKLTHRQTYNFEFVWENWEIIK